MGAVERHLLLPITNTIQEGDVLLGLASNGLHSNGFSLIRKIIARSQYTYSSPCPWENPRISVRSSTDPSNNDENLSSPSTLTLGRTLLEPTRIYVDQILPVTKRGLVKAMSHITGGGFIENIPRVLPKDLGCYVDADTWPYPPAFRWLKREGVVDALEMARTYNNGIGMVLIVAPENVKVVQELLEREGQENPAQVYRIGEIIRKTGVEMRNLDAWNSDI